MEEKSSRSKKTLLYNIVFIAVCLGIFLFLWTAPPETTKKLPHDQDHEKFHAMGKKQAEKYCEPCHNPDGAAPLPGGHPPKYRCLFCHKQNR